ncbi:MAG: NADPH-dependent 7-cyano-7-deazaguanine reductase QueF [Opitutae bacterium]|nr:NADPH-dependent 7-cyano-7-deazaguanine reductase QueF [Opitutae bacterium]
MTTEPSDTADLSELGKGATQPQRKLETFPNRHPGRNYLVELETQEFICLCPATGQPDFAEIRILYAPDQRIVESKSLKLYLWSFRDEGIFHEHFGNVLLDDLVSALAPRWCEVEAKFNSRGGIGITVRAEHGTKPVSS